MFDVKIFGLSTIRLDEASVTRDENLTDFDINVRVGFDEITVTGEYDLKGSFGWFEVDSNGTRDFAINIHGASSATLIHLEMVEDGGCAPGTRFNRKVAWLEFLHDKKVNSVYSDFLKKGAQCDSSNQTPSFKTNYFIESIPSQRAT